MSICRKGLHEFEGLQCKECKKASSSHWHQDNIEQQKAKQRMWYENNTEYKKTKSNEWKNQNTQKFNDYQDEYYSTYYGLNKDKYAKATARRRAVKKHATLNLSEDQNKLIGEFYIESVRLSKETNIPHQVDHIIPLQGETVSGLHVPWNLRVITREENYKKGNKLLEDL